MRSPLVEEHRGSQFSEVVGSVPLFVVEDVNVQFARSGRLLRDLHGRVTSLLDTHHLPGDAVTEKVQGDVGKG